MIILILIVILLVILITHVDGFWTLAHWVRRDPLGRERRPRASFRANNKFLNNSGVAHSQTWQSAGNACAVRRGLAFVRHALLSSSSLLSVFVSVFGLVCLRSRHDNPRIKHVCGRRFGAATWQSFGRPGGLALGPPSPLFGAPGAPPRAGRSGPLPIAS